MGAEASDDTYRKIAPAPTARHITAQAVPPQRAPLLVGVEAWVHVQNGYKGLKARPIGLYMLRKNSLTRNQFLTRWRGPKAHERTHQKLGPAEGGGLLS